MKVYGSERLKRLIDEADEAIRRLGVVRIAAEEAQPEETNCLPSAHVLCNGEMLELSDSVPVQPVDLERLLIGDFTGGNSSLLPQSGPSDGSRAVERGMTICHCTHRSDSTLGLCGVPLPFADNLNQDL